MSSDQELAALAKAWSAVGRPFVRLRVAEAEGSTPRERGASMLVTADEAVGTIGGGRLEWDAVAQARKMLATGEREARAAVPLGPAIGQCCGGRVTIAYDRPDMAEAERMAADAAAAAAARPCVLIYGAGHVGRALALALAPLPFRVTLADGRADELARAPAQGVELRLTDALASLAGQAPDGSAHVVMTHSHALDCIIAATVLERGRFRYLGVIGSKTKRASFRRALRGVGIGDDAIRRVVCPIGGGGTRDKRPEVIAALAAAEIVRAVL